MKDQTGAVVPGAVVSGEWTGLTTGKKSAATNSYGVASMWSNYVYRRGTFTFAVTGVSLTGYNYEFAQNMKTKVSVTTP